MIADLIVVGGGPVGLGAAIEARLAGLDVVVLEQRDGVLDKACGEGLMPAALDALDRWGVRVDGRPIAGFRYSDGDREAVHRFRGAKGRGVRRTALHAALAGRAGALGVPVERATVRRLEQDEHGVTVGDRRARFVIGADGLRSPTRRALGLDRRARGAARYGLRRHFRVEPWSDLVEVHWLADAELYLTPVASDLVGVAVLGRRGLDLDRAIAAAPEVADRLAGAAPVGVVRGAGPLRQHATRAVLGRVALAGDAAGYLDALTGEGLALGFGAARLAAEAVAAGDLHGLDERMRRAGRTSRLLTWGALRLATSPLRRQVVPIAATVPGVFGAAVEALGRPEPARR